MFKAKKQKWQLISLLDKIHTLNVDIINKNPNFIVTINIDKIPYLIHEKSQITNNKNNLLEYVHIIISHKNVPVTKLTYKMNNIIKKYITVGEIVTSARYNAFNLINNIIVDNNDNPDKETKEQIPFNEITLNDNEHVSTEGNYFVFDIMLDNIDTKIIPRNLLNYPKMVFSHSGLNLTNTEISKLTTHINRNLDTKTILSQIENARSCHKNIVEFWENLKKNTDNIITINHENKYHVNGKIFIGDKYISFKNAASNKTEYFKSSSVTHFEVEEINEKPV